MANYETDEETLDALKAWWKENGTSVIGGLVVGISAIVGFKQWGNYQEQQSQSASSLYQAMNELKANKKNDEFYASGSEIILEYSSTPYSSLAAFAMAKNYIDEKKYSNAIDKLDWILSNSNDDGLKHIARIRLTRLLLIENKNDRALELVKSATSESFKSDYSELLGDVYVATEKYALAKEAYKSALASNIKSKEKREFIEMKLNDIVIVEKPSIEKS